MAYQSVGINRTFREQLDIAKQAQYLNLLFSHILLFAFYVVFKIDYKWKRNFKQSKIVSRIIKMTIEGKKMVIFQHYFIYYNWFYRIFWLSNSTSLS